LNASRISSRSFTKSRTNVSSFSGWIRFNRETVCMAGEQVDPARMYAIGSELDASGIYLDEEVDRSSAGYFCAWDMALEKELDRGI
jgi:hypothetical protein